MGYLKKYLFKTREVIIIPLIQIPTKMCILINMAKKKPTKNRLPANKRPKIKVTIAKLNIP